MKTLIKSLALTISLAAVTASATFAQTRWVDQTKTAATYETGIFITKAGKLRIALDKEEGGTVSIRLKNVDGRVLYYRHLSRNDRIYRTRLNLRQLKDGVYELEITDGVETTTQNVTILTRKPTTPDRIVSIR